MALLSAPELEGHGHVATAGRLAGRVALISGGAGGVGEAASRLFAAEGARVVIVDRQQSGEALAAELRSGGYSVVFARADVSVAREVEAAVQAGLDAFGFIDVLFNHAGTIIIKPFLDTTEADWDTLMAVNVKSMFLMTKAVLPSMLARGKGSVVCTSSISAVAATPMEVLYGATKGAVHQFVRGIATEYRDRGIRCNAVCPGFIRTPHGLREVAELQALGVDTSAAAIAAQQGRMCEPDEVARAALFLASDEASFVNGTHLFVDNTFTAV